jgi:hypothetical protein
LLSPFGFGIEIGSSASSLGSPDAAPDFSGGAMAANAYELNVDNEVDMMAISCG